MDVNDDEKHRRPIHMNVTDQPAVVDVSHDAFNAVKGVVDMRRIVHGKDDAGDDHHHKADARQGAEVPKII